MYIYRWKIVVMYYDIMLCMGFMYSWHSSWTYFLVSLHQIVYPSEFTGIEFQYWIKLDCGMSNFTQRVNRCTHTHTHTHKCTHTCTHTCTSPPPHTHTLTPTHPPTHRSWQWNWNLHHWRSQVHFPEPTVQCSLCLWPISGATSTLQFYLYINPGDAMWCPYHKWANILSVIDRDDSCGQCDYHRNVFTCNTGFWPRVPTTILWNL